MRAFVKEPERWAAATATAEPARVREIFAPDMRARTVSALIVAVIALITWWSCNAFIQAMSNSLAGAEAGSAAGWMPPPPRCSSATG